MPSPETPPTLARVREARDTLERAALYLNDFHAPPRVINLSLETSVAAMNVIDWLLGDDGGLFERHLKSLELVLGRPKNGTRRNPTAPKRDRAGA